MPCVIAVFECSYLGAVVDLLETLQEHESAEVSVLVRGATQLYRMIYRSTDTAWMPSCLEDENTKLVDFLSA